MKKRTRRQITRRRGGAGAHASRRSNGHQRSGKDIVESGRVNRMVYQQRQLSTKQNELDMEQLHLVEDLATEIITKPENRHFVIGKYLRILFDPNLTEEEMQEIDTMIPEGDEKTRFEHYGVNPTLRKLLYYTLIMTVITALVFPAKGRHRG